MTREHFIELANRVCPAHREGLVIDARRGDTGWEIQRATGEWLYCSSAMARDVYALAAKESA